jgi:hypothetical protein
MKNVAGAIPRSVMVKSPLESRYRKTLVRPTLTLDGDGMTRLRASSASIREIAAQLQLSSATVQHALRQC